jgi:hypothetical protein
MRPIKYEPFTKAVARGVGSRLTCAGPNESYVFGGEGEAGASNGSAVRVQRGPGFGLVARAESMGIASCAEEVQASDSHSISLLLNWSGGAIGGATTTLGSLHRSAARHLRNRETPRPSIARRAVVLRLARACSPPVPPVRANLGSS